VRPAGARAGPGHRPYCVRVLTSDTEAAPEEPGGPADDPDRGPDRPPSRHRVARVVGAVGRLMITSGTVILLLVAYQLWGTNLQTDRSQGELADEFSTLVDDGAAPPPTTEPSATASTTAPAPTTSTTAPTTVGPPAVAPDIAPPALGQPIGNFSIPAIGVHRFWTVEGTGTDQLERGAAHYPGTPLPGQAGNAAVAGHRTTYGAPLHNVEDLVAGDEILFETLQGRFRYEVREIRIVEPTAVEVVQPQNATPEDPDGEDLLTLTACHPKHSADQRIIVVAALVGTPVPTLPGQEDAAREVIEASGGEHGPDEGAIDAFVTEPALTFPGAWWGLLCLALWAATRVLAYRQRRRGLARRAVPYLVGTPICLVVLYLFFESFSYEGLVRTLGLSI